MCIILGTFFKCPVQTELNGNCQNMQLGKKDQGTASLRKPKL